MGHSMICTMMGDTMEDAPQRYLITDDFMAYPMECPICATSHGLFHDNHRTSHGDTSWGTYIHKMRDTPMDTIIGCAHDASQCPIVFSMHPRRIARIGEAVMAHMSRGNYRGISHGVCHGPVLYTLYLAYDRTPHEVYSREILFPYGMYHGI